MDINLAKNIKPNILNMQGLYNFNTHSCGLNSKKI